MPTAASAAGLITVPCAPVSRSSCVLPPPLIRAFTMIGWPGVNGMRAVPVPPAPPPLAALPVPAAGEAAADGPGAAGSAAHGWGPLIITAPLRNRGGMLLIPWE